jgi:spore coat protein CotH
MYKMNLRNLKILIILLIVAFLVFGGCENFLVSTYDTDSTYDADEDIETGWTEASHGKSAEADYELIFDDTLVHRIDITISSAYYEEMEEDMESMYGSFDSGMGTTTFSDETPMWAPVTVSYNDKAWTYVGMRYKGNSSLSRAWMSGIHKLPFRLDFDKFEDFYTETDDQRFWGFEKLTFSNGMNDDSLLRDKMASVVFQNRGVPAAEAAFYRVYVDSGDGPVYWGLYTMLEDPSDQMLGTQFGDGSGNLYKPDDEDYSTLAFFDEDYYPKKTNEDEDDWTDIESFIETINNSSLSDEAWKTAMEAIFDVDGFLDYLAINNTIENWDVYGEKAHNYYLYADPSNENIFTWFPWDMNESFTYSKMSLSFSMSDVRSSWPLIYYIMAQDEYCERYEDKLYNYFVEGSDDYYDLEEITSMMASYSELIEDYVIGDNGELDGYTWLDYDSEFTAGLEDVQEHIEDRFDDVAEYLIEIDYEP